jgi:hypothetical protein
MQTVQAFKESIAERVRRLQSGFDLYYAGDEPFEFQYHGNFYTIPAHGTLKVMDVYGIPTSSQNAQMSVEEKKHVRDLVTMEMRTGKKPKNLKLIISALNAIEYAVSHYADRGVCFLSGNKEEDDRDKKEAGERYQVWRIKEAENILRAYENRNEAFARNPRNQGKLPPPMGDRELKAQEFLDDQRVSARGRKQYVCPAPFCGYSADDDKVMKDSGEVVVEGSGADRIKRHLEASHPTLKLEEQRAEGRRKAS